MNKSLSIIASLGILCMACNESNELPVENFEELSGIKKMLTDFYCAGNKNSRSSDSNIRISHITRQSYRIEGDTVVPIPQSMGRSMYEEPSDSVFEIATAEFSIGDNNGYAILSDDERLNEIYFFTENGAIADTADIPAVKDIFELTPFLAMQTLNDHRVDPFRPVDPGEPFDPDSPTGPTDIPEDFTIGPMIITEWSQGWPYNMYGRYCTCSSCSAWDMNGYSPMGCVTIATAQVVATWDTYFSFQKYSYKTFYGTRSTANIINKKTPITEEEEKKAAHICYEVALGCQTKFDCNESHSNLVYAYQYLKEIGCAVQFINGSIDAEAIKTHLTHYPVLASGKRSGNKGHAWIIDGLKRVDGIYHYHCNWGWGGKCNGWASSNYYTAENKETHELKRYSDNLRAIYIFNRPFAN